MIDVIDIYKYLVILSALCIIFRNIISGKVLKVDLLLIRSLMDGKSGRKGMIEYQRQ